MICPTCKQTIPYKRLPLNGHVNWLPVKIKGVEYTAVDWGSIKEWRWYCDGKMYYAPAIPLLFVERID